MTATSGSRRLNTSRPERQLGVPLPCQQTTGTLPAISQVGPTVEAERKRSLDVQGTLSFQPPADARSPLRHALAAAMQRQVGGGASTPVVPPGSRSISPTATLRAVATAISSSVPRGRNSPGQAVAENAVAAATRRFAAHGLSGTDAGYWLVSCQVVPMEPAQVGEVECCASERAGRCQGRPQRASGEDCG
jgi:hypothetical protein